MGLGVDRKFRLRSLVIPNSDSEGRSFLSAPNHDRFFFLHTFWYPAFDFNVVIFLYVDICHIESLHLTWRHNDANYQRLNDRVTWPPIQPMHVLLFLFIYPTGRIRVCKIRFVSTGENLICKKCISFAWIKFLSADEEILLILMLDLPRNLDLYGLVW